MPGIRLIRAAVAMVFVLGWLAPAPTVVRVAAASDPVIAAAGDIACDPADPHFNNGLGSGNGVTDLCRQGAVSDLLVGGGYSAVLSLGDNQYYCGSLAAYQQSYDLSWGRVKAITHPVVGNHEYLTDPGTGSATGCDATNVAAAGYFGYFGSAAGTAGQGYYSYDVGAWHLIAINSNCTDAGGCVASSPQGQWLAADLATHQNQCILAYWHIPLFSSGGRAAVNTYPIWQQLYAAHADLVLDGHDHIYERFAPQTPDGIADPVSGIRQITVGTGGANHTSIAALAANSVVADTTSFGILKLSLHPGSYDWQFLPVDGSFTDSGSAACHNTGTVTDHIAVSPTSATINAGGPQAYTAEAFDVHNNSLGNVTGATSFSISGGGSCTLAVCTSSVLGDHTVTGSDGGIKATTILHVIHGVASKLTVAGPAAAIAGVAGSYSVTAQDAFNNTVTDYPGTVTITSSDGAMSSSPASGTLTSGVRTFHVTLNTVGSQTVGATDGSLVASAVPVDVSPVSGTYHPLTPTRLLDTRNGTGLSGPFGSHAARTFTVAGAGGVPADAMAVTGNLTVTGQTSMGFLYIGPNATNNPTSSTLNFPAGDDRANAVTVALGSGGTLSVTYAAPTLGPTAHVIFDVTGYFTPDTTGATYHPLLPTRLLDTRSGNGLSGPLSSHTAQTVVISGPTRGNVVPSNATAVTGNLTVTGQTSMGFLYIGPNATNNPTSSTLNFPAGDDRANAVTVALGPGGTLSVTYAAPSLGPTTQVIFDVTGYYTPDMTGATYVPLTPARVLDSRNGTGLSGASSSHVARAFGVVGGSSGVAANAIAVTGNLTVTGQTSPGYLYVGPAAMDNPASSTLNFPLGDDRANAVTVAVGSGGLLWVTFAAPTLGPTAQVIFDVTGYFRP